MVKKAMSMTISQIKQKLIEHGVPLPPSSSRKDEYERLYVQEVLSQSKSWAQSKGAGGEFSSDDEVDAGFGNDDDVVVDSSVTLAVNGNREVNGKVGIEDAPLEMDLEIFAEVSQLTNEEIYTQLIELGQMVGPVVATTREMYIKKLAFVKSNVEVGINGTEVHLNGHHDSLPVNGFSSDEDEMTTVPPPRKSRSSSRKHSTPPVESTVEDKKEKTVRKMYKTVDTYSQVSVTWQKDKSGKEENLTQGKLDQQDEMVPKLPKANLKGKATGGSSLIKLTLLLVLASLLIAYAYFNMMESVPLVDEIDQAIDDAIKEVGQKSPAIEEL